MNNIDTKHWSFKEGVAAGKAQDFHRRGVTALKLSTAKTLLEIDILKHWLKGFDEGFYEPAEVSDDACPRCGTELQVGRALVNPRGMADYGAARQLSRVSETWSARMVSCQKCPTCGYSEQELGNGVHVDRVGCHT